MKAQEGDEIVRRDTNRGRFYPLTLPDGTGVNYPSVTTLLGAISKKALVNWAARTERELVADASTQLYLDVAGTPKMTEIAYRASLETRIGKVRAFKREMEAAADIGTAVHKRIEWGLRKELGQKVGREPRLCEKGEWAYMAYSDWQNSVELKPLFLERRVYSVTHEYAGTLDMFGIINGVPTVVDFKTSKGIYGEALIQVAALIVALRESGQGDAKAGLVLRLPKVDTDPEFEVVDIAARSAEWYGIERAVAEGYLFDLFLAAKRIWWSQYHADQAYWDARKKCEGASDAA